MINDSLHDIVQSNEIIELLKNEKAKSFLSEHFDEKPEKLALSYRNKVDFNLSVLTQLLQLYHKAVHKIPEWVENRCAIHAKSYEQCTSAVVAKFKSTLFSGNKMIDLTSGLGVDAYYFSKSFDSVICLEKDSETCAFAQYNQRVLGTSNVSIFHSDLENYTLDDWYDLIYVDPDRRIEDKEQRKDVATYSPNIFVWYKKLLKHTNCLAIKLSPMTDISYLRNEIPEIDNIYVIAYKNEVKELLITVSPEVRSTLIHAVELNDDTTLSYSEKTNNQEIHIGHEGKVLLEPSRAIIKAGLASNYCQHLGLTFLSLRGLYFFSENTIPEFMGRQYEIITQLSSQWKEIKKYLKSKKIKAIQIAQRNFFDDVKTIRKKLQINDGGETTLIFSRDENGNAICLHVRQLL